MFLVSVKPRLMLVFISVTLGMLVEAFKGKEILKSEYIFIYLNLLKTKNKPHADVQCPISRYSHYIIIGKEMRVPHSSGSLYTLMCEVTECQILGAGVWKGYDFQAFKFKFFKNKVLAKQNISEDTIWSPICQHTLFKVTAAPSNVLCWIRKKKVLKVSLKKKCHTVESGAKH